MSLEEINYVEEPGRLLERTDGWISSLAHHGVVTNAIRTALETEVGQSRGGRLDVPNDPLLVTMICGPTAVGKSTLINALAGADISKVGIGAETSGAVIYLHERDDPLRLFEYAEALGKISRGPSLVRHTRDELLHKVLIDTPDIDSVVREHGVLTAALMHCADIVLFVTSPTKYKNMQSARWIAEIRQQRAVAFVLNKWDRSIGAQFDKRNVINEDFFEVLRSSGFSNPVIFKTSAVINIEGEEIENDLLALRDWLSISLDRTASAGIQNRRRRAAWGRLSAVIASVSIEPFLDHPFAEEIARRLTETHAHAFAIAKVKASALQLNDPGAGGMRGKDGLAAWSKRVFQLNLKQRFQNYLPGRRALKRLSVFMEAAGAAADTSASQSNQIGTSIEALLTGLTTAIAQDNEGVGWPLGPVIAAWMLNIHNFSQESSQLLADAEHEVIAEKTKLSLRLVVGQAILIIIELLMATVLILTIWRIGLGFFQGKYFQGAMIMDALVLLATSFIAGVVVNNFFFPSPVFRFRKLVERRGQTKVDRCLAAMRASLNDQIQAIKELAETQHHLVIGIDTLISALVSKQENLPAGVERLFWGSPPAPNDAKLVKKPEVGTGEGSVVKKLPKFD